MVITPSASHTEPLVYTNISWFSSSITGPFLAIPKLLISTFSDRPSCSSNMYTYICCNWCSFFCISSCYSSVHNQETNLVSLKFHLTDRSSPVTARHSFKWPAYIDVVFPRAARVRGLHGLPVPTAIRYCQTAERKETRELLKSHCY